MYPTSEAYKTAIKQNVRDVKITGTITLKDASVINISDADIVQGSLYFTEQCVSGEDIEIGNVYASEMGLSLISPPENPYSLDGARVVMNFGIDTGGSYEYVPLGYFYVTEIERKAATVNLKALDGMILLDVDIAGVQTSGTPFEIVEACCARAGVTLATSLTTFNTFANADTMFVLPEENTVKTCRDLLMWVCQLTGTFARMNRQGHLEVVPVTARASVREIVKADRFFSDVSDFFIKVAKMTMKVGEVEYFQGSDGMTMTLDENPFLIGREDAGINAALSNILNQVTLAEYTPSNVDFPGDPSLQAGDYVTLTDAGILDSEVETGTYFLSPAFPASIEVRRNIATSMITHHTWRYRGKHNLKSAGKSDLIQGVQSQQSKVVGIARAAQEIAKTANQSTQLINDAIGGHVLIRQNPDETNEILIMDSADPDQAVKIWRWNMGGLGYSDNCTGVDNPARQYEVAMTMDGAINANFIKTGKIAAQYITVGPESVFADGYDPTAIEIGGRNLIIRYNEVPDTMIGENGVSAPLVGSSMTNDFIPVQPGDALTFSQVIQGTGDDYFRCGFYTDPLDSASYVVRRISNNATVFTETVPEGAYWLRVSYAAKNKVQLERGTRSTDWTPAPEDTEDYADQKAAEAQAAAEAVASAEALVAQVNAEAYADGIVTAEEQARIDDANAKLAEAKTHADTKSGEAQSAAQSYAEQKAADAQSAAEAVARAEALVAQVNAEAYADGVVTAEEQARINDAEAKLAEAKTHAEAKAGEAEQAAKDCAEQQLADHDANPSPHNLPSYAKMESTGFKVYDDQGNLRTHMGQYAPGEFGNWVDAGFYMLRDKGMDMSLLQLPNLIPDHSFECLETSGDIDVTYYDFEIKATSGNYFEWNKIGSPRLLSARQVSIYPESIFGLQSVVVNSTNNLTIYCRVLPNTTYFLSGFTAGGYRGSLGTPRFFLRYRDMDVQEITTEGVNFTPNDGAFNWRRVGTKLTTPEGCYLLEIRPVALNENYVYWDALQLVEGDKPVRYEPEENLWKHMFGASGVPLQGHIVESGSNTNGHYIKFSNGKQVCWENHYIGNVEFIAQTANAVYGGHTGTLTFPASFIENPVAICNARSNGYLNSQVSSVAKSNLQIRIWSNYSTNMTGVTRDWVAVGRWK